MKLLTYYFLLLLSIIFTGNSFAQPETEFLDPVKWTFELGKKVGDQYELRLKATIDEGWHLYSHFIEEGGPIPTNITFEENTAVEIKDKLIENGKRISAFDDAFEMELAWFANEVTFIQKVKLLTGFNSTVLKGEVEFMVCDDHQCLPPEYIPFSFALGEVKEIAVIENNLVDEITKTEGLVADIGEFKEPTKWSYRVSKYGVNLKVEWKVELDKDWQIYSKDIGDGGPLPTEFHFNDGNNIEIIGNLIEEGALIRKKEILFDNMKLLSYKDQVVYSQVIKWTNQKNSVLTGTIDYMVCAEVCITGGIDFNINLTEQDKWIVLDEVSKEISTQSDSILFDWTKSQTCIGHEEEENTNTKGNWLIFLLGFGGGLFALLTPCVFPMIPLTVSFFTKKNQDRKKGIINAFIYGISIIVLYVGLSLIITGIFGADVMNQMAASPIINTLFFIIFVVFAISFFGYFEITLPSSWTNQADKAANKGGLIGIFFMAFTLALVSFSCTGPIIGSLLVEAATGESATILGRIPLRPMIGMFGFGLALALPFTLFALFPSWLNTLPQSGGWLNVVKVFLGFLELALAFKFLSVADMTGNWNLLKIEPFLIIWILIFVGLALYMFGLIHFPHDSKGATISWSRRLIGAVSVLFTVYLLMGLINDSPRKLLSGLAPPSYYSFFNEKDCPAGLNNCFKEFDEGVAFAKNEDMPILIDFTGDGCVNCRKMEENVWTEKQVNELLQKYVVISLYVDDTKKLDEADTYISNASGKEKKIRTVGNRWHDFQIKNFKRVSQPYYVLISPDLEVLNQPVAYTPNNEEYQKWLQCGLNSFSGICPSCPK